MLFVALRPENNDRCDAQWHVLSWVVGKILCGLMWCNNTGKAQRQQRDYLWVSCKVLSFKGCSVKTPFFTVSRVSTHESWHTSWSFTGQSPKLWAIKFPVSVLLNIYKYSLAAAITSVLLHWLERRPMKCCCRKRISCRDYVVFWFF